MTRSKLLCLLPLLPGIVFSGCSSTNSDGGVSDPIPASPVAYYVPEPEPEPDPVVEEIAQTEVEKPVEVEVEVKEKVKPPAPKAAEPATFTILGFIKYVELEGGFFGIMTADGTKYFPEYLEQDFKVDGLSVRLLAKPQEQILGIQMWGTPIEILKIEAN